jgi:hypothetical protein
MQLPEFMKPDVADNPPQWHHWIFSTADVPTRQNGECALQVTDGTLWPQIIDHRPDQVLAQPYCKAPC